jgi:hypothetical protein
MFFTTSYTEGFLFRAGHRGGVRGNRNRGDSTGNVGGCGETCRRNVALVDVGVGVRRNVATIGEMGLSKIDRGDAGRRGVASWERYCWFIEGFGRARNGFVVELGETRERMDAKGEGVSGSQ